MKDSIKAMADKFLSWRLPKDFYPDAGISFKADYNENTSYPRKHEPLGTNLFHAEQAIQMFEHCCSEELTKREAAARQQGFEEGKQRIEELEESNSELCAAFNRANGPDTFLGEPAFMQYVPDTISTDKNAYDAETAFNAGKQAGRDEVLKELSEQEPFCYFRILDNKPDWDEDCVSVDTACADTYIDDAPERYKAVALIPRPTAPVTKE